LATVVTNCIKSIAKLETLLGKALPLLSDSRLRPMLKALSNVWYGCKIKEIKSQLAQSLQPPNLNYRPQSATMAMVVLQSDNVVDL
jgi:hypothetical protein